MSTITDKVLQITPEQLLELPDADRFELVDGELVELPMGWQSSWIGGRLHYLVSAYCSTNAIGRVAPADAGYQCFPSDPLKVRRPDVSFIHNDRLPPDDELQGYCRIAPDLAAEVVSPNDLYTSIEEKAAEYLAAGVKLVWVVNPSLQSVRVHRADGSITDLGRDDELCGEAALPGFRCRVSDLFEVPGES